ncbi:hypothetical protein JVU11DRAFT_10040 [Chiua virens]|nr:hypothetical protein JVU11DRAFT_10040 [Chiua virens]
MVLGPMGGGASSVVNLIAGKEVAQVSADTSRCTKKMASYHIDLKDGAKAVPITLYDIPGFNYNAKSPLEFPRVPVSLAIICLEDFPAQVRATAEYLKDKWKETWRRKYSGSGRHQSYCAAARRWLIHVCLIKRKKEESTRQLHSLIIQHLSARKITHRTRAS